MAFRERKTAAVILQTQEVFDADRLHLCFTEEFGKIRARAKGVRRLKSRLAGHLLEYLPTQLELVERDGWFLIVQAQSSQAGHYPRHSLAFLQHAELLAEVLDHLLPDREPHPDLYLGLEYTLERLHARCDHAELPDNQRLVLLVGEYIFKTLILLGYQPQLEQCVVSGEPLQKEGVAWSSQLGGAVNRATQQAAQAPCLPLRSASSIVVLRQLARPEFVGERLHMPEEVREEVGQVIFDYLQTVLGKPLKSYALLPRLTA